MIHYYKKIVFGACIAFAALMLSFDVPKGWTASGVDPTQYDCGLAKGAGRNGGNAGTIQALNVGPNPIHKSPFGTLRQSCKATKFLGKRVRMTGWMRSENVNEWAGFWMRVDQAEPLEVLGFDNMHDRPVKETTGWKSYEIVLDVPSSAAYIVYGAILTGKGQIWFDDVKLEIVDKTVPVTSTIAQTKFKVTTDEPANLDFEN
jgi:hypothetical protein